MGHPWEAEAPLFSQSGTSCHLPSSWFLLLLDSTPFAHPSGHQPAVHTQSHPELPLHAPCFLPVPCPGSRHPPGTIFLLDRSWGHSPRAMVDSTPTPGKLAPGEARYQLESLLVFMFQAYQLPGGAQKSTCLARCSQPGMRAVNFSLGSWNPSSLPALRVPLRGQVGTIGHPQGPLPGAPPDPEAPPCQAGGPGVDTEMCPDPFSALPWTLRSTRKHSLADISISYADMYTLHKMIHLCFRNRVGMR